MADRPRPVTRPARPWPTRWPSCAACPSPPPSSRQTAKAASPPAWVGPWPTPSTEPEPTGCIPARVRHDLAVLGRSPERHLAEKVTLALVGLLFAPAIAVLLALGGAHLPLVVPLWASLIFMVAGFFAPDLGIRADAARRRRDFRHALSSFLGSRRGRPGRWRRRRDGALADAASVGSGWAFGYLRRALDQARLARQTPWAALGRLGQQLGVGELSELAASVALAGTEGAKVRASLAAKAASLRTHELAEAETADQAATERMSLPVVLLFAGFLLFLGYPAVQKVLHRALTCQPTPTERPTKGNPSMKGQAPCSPS